MEEQIKRAAECRAQHGSLSCDDAHAIAQSYSVSPGEVGRVISSTALRFYRCQLGLFGYGNKAEGKSKIVVKATNLPDEIVAALRAEAVDGRVPCIKVWQIAAQFAYPRLGIANIIEALGLKVAPCQLGCF